MSGSLVSMTRNVPFRHLFKPASPNGLGMWPEEPDRESALGRAAWASDWGLDRVAAATDPERVAQVPALAA